MTVVRKTPALYAAGKYELREPFIADVNATYTCMAIRSFKDILELKEDVFTNYYEPYEISESDFNADSAAQVCIVTLMSETAELIYVPDSYINLYPDVSNVNYSRIVLSTDLGALPDSLMLDYLITQLENACSDVIGVVPTVLVHKSPTVDFISAEQAATLEAARTAGIGILKTDYTRNRELQAQVTAQQLIIEQLKNLCIANGLL